MYQDSKVGFSRTELEVLKKAMNAIEKETCIRFEEVMPEPNTKWAMFMKKSNGDGTCYERHITNNLKNRNVRNRNGGNLGKVFDNFHLMSGGCQFNGAFVSYSPGTRRPSLMVSDIEIVDSKGVVGLFTHELLHVLRIGHTQKRPGTISRLLSHIISQSGPRLAQPSHPTRPTLLQV